MTSKSFAAWVAESWDHEIHEETARQWLHKLGFKQKSSAKGVYFDGHERDDVVIAREEYLSILEKADQKKYGSQNVLQENERPIIRVYHDESTFYANAQQSSYWNDGTNTVPRQKSMGSAIMVSDFIDEVGGFLEIGDMKARTTLEHQKDGYFTNDQIVNQVDKAMGIFEAKYPGAQGLFLFDNAPSHRKFASDALNVKSMNVGPGGKQAKLRDTIWQGHPQCLTLPDGKPKGMRLILEERGIDTTGWTAKEMQAELASHEDFANEKTVVEKVVEERGHICIFIPKFHCELNPIERVWCHAKKHVRANSNGTVPRLRKLVPESLSTVDVTLIKKFFATASDYERGYREGHSAFNIESAVKTYKSHKRVYE